MITYRFFFLLLFNRYNRFIVIRDFWPFSEISGTLLDRLDETVDRDAESAWEAEIVMRLKEIDESKVNLIPWAEARARIAEP